MTDKRWIAESKQFYCLGLNLLKFAVGLACVRLIFGIHGLTALALLFGLGGTLMTVMHLKKRFYQAINASTIAIGRVEELEKSERLQNTSTQ